MKTTRGNEPRRGAIFGVISRQNSKLRRSGIFITMPPLRGFGSWLSVRYKDGAPTELGRGVVQL
jgi:hypothetical protein